MAAQESQSNKSATEFPSQTLSNIVCKQPYPLVTVQFVSGIGPRAQLLPASLDLVIHRSKLITLTDLYNFINRSEDVRAQLMTKFLVTVPYSVQAIGVYTIQGCELVLSRHIGQGGFHQRLSEDIWTDILGYGDPSGIRTNRTDMGAIVKVSLNPSVTLKAMGGIGIPYTGEFSWDLTPVDPNRDPLAERRY